jgi:glycerol kinase
MRILAIDQGTTGTKGFVLDSCGFHRIDARRHRQIHPQPAWVEHDPEELLAHVASFIRRAGVVDAIALANQGETIVAWDRTSGRPLCNAIVWQDARTEEIVARMKAAGAESLSLARSGLPLDPYFSATKLRWVLDHVAEARALLAAGRLGLATSDAFFLDRLAGVYATDVSTASRTGLMNLETLAWDAELCALHGVPEAVLPEIRPTVGAFGTIEGVPVCASVVDQQAALFGHQLEQPGDLKITFGTGAFALGLTGDRPVRGLPAGLLPTVAWRHGRDPVSFALDGGIYSAASAVDWAQGLGLFSDHAELDGYASPAAARGLVFVPALVGLACPHWDRRAGGLWIGLAPDTTRRDLCQAVLEGIAFRAAELIDAFAVATGRRGVVSIDGGLSRNVHFTQFLCDLAERPIDVVAETDMTAQGAARLAAAAGPALPDVPSPARHRLTPRAIGAPGLRARFADAIARSRGWHDQSRPA